MSSFEGCIKMFKARFELVRVYFLSDKFFAYVAVLPVFFGWLVVLTWREENPKLRSLATDSLILSLAFWALLLLGAFVSWFPRFGPYLANLFHLLGIVIYLGVSLYFFYLVAREREIPDLPVVVDLRNKVYEFLN